MFRLFRIQIVLVLVVLSLAACAPTAIQSASGIKPTVLIETVETKPTNATAVPTTVAAVELPQLKVHDVQLKIGVGSPIPVDAFISAELPDTCAQLAEVKMARKDFLFEITMSVTPGTREECMRDTLPFRMYVPLNMVNLPEGTYTAVVNGVSTTFQWPSEPTITPEPAVTTPGNLVRYQGPNPYRSTPAFSVDYDSSIWEFVEKDGSGREPRLDHRSLSNCSVWLGAGPVGAKPVSKANLAGYDWTIFLVQPDIMMYSIPWNDISFIFGLILPEPYTPDVKSSCQQALEAVMQTFQVVTD
jgi:hypothetical protein